MSKKPIKKKIENSEYEAQRHEHIETMWNMFFGALESKCTMSDFNAVVGHRIPKVQELDTRADYTKKAQRFTLIEGGKTE